jgi:hypothetical protein
VGIDGQRWVRIVLRVGIVAVVALAVILVETRTRSGVLWRLITFTYQANLLAAVYYALTLVSPRTDRRAGLRGAVVLYVVVAGLIWNLFLSGVSMGYTGANVLLHVVVPVLALAEWVLVGRDQARVRWWQPVAWLAYPAAYLGAAVLILNHLGRRAPYYFLDPGAIGTSAVIGNVALLALGFLGLGFSLFGVARLVEKSRLRV